MYVKVSNPIKKIIAEALSGTATARIEKLTPEQYERLVDYNLLKHTSDYNNGLFKVIKVIYDPELYALPAYITTWDLITTYKESDGSLAGFIDKIKNQYAI